MTNLCEQVVDEETNLLCGEPATDSIQVRNRSGKFRVLVCAKHKAEQNRAFAAMRTESRK